jgi:hypothetical protein
MPPSSSLKPLTLDCIEAGNLVDEVNSALDRISRDVVDRYTIQKARQVAIVIEINPGDAINTKSGMKLMPTIDWTVRYKVPGASGVTTRAFVENLHGKQTLMINANDPLGADPNQGTIFDNLPKEEDSHPKKE